MRQICMVPSNTLSSSDASRLALKLLEEPIVRDYLAETNYLPAALAATLVPGEQDWWDTLDRASYAAVLSKRHRKAHYDRLMADRTLRWPDISTFNGPTVRWFAYGSAVAAPPIGGKGANNRSEMYEIKPDNQKGLTDAQEKLVDVESSYRRYLIGDVYLRGHAYPHLLSKTIPLDCRFASVYRYLVNLFLKPLRAGVFSIEIRVRRAEPGALLYKICVWLDGLDKASRESAWIVANFAVRMLARINSAGHPAELRKIEELLDGLEPVEPLGKSARQLQWVIDGRDYRQVPYLHIKPGPIADEIEPRLAGIRDGMYSRLLGQPGERYYIAADESWYRTNVVLMRQLRMRAQVRWLGTQDAMRSAAARSLVGLSTAVTITAGDLLKAAADGAIRLAEPVIRWINENRREILVIVGVTIIVTALLIVTLGGATPAILALGAGAGVGTASAGEAAVATAAVGEAIGGTVVAGELAGGGAMIAPVMATVAPEAAAVSAVPVAAAGEAAGASNLIGLARSLAATSLTAAETGGAAAQRLADDVLIKALTNPGVQASLRTSVQALDLPAVAVIGLAPSRAYAYSGPTGDRVPAAAFQDTNSVDLGVGRLLLLKARKVLPYGVTSMPALYDEFAADLFADPAVTRPSSTKIGKLRMLGWFDVR